MARFLVVVAICLVAGASANHPAWMENLHNTENEHRAEHGVKPLTMNEELNKLAQVWADKLANECQKLSKKSHAEKDVRQFNGKTAGENIYSGSTSEVDTIQQYALDNGHKAADKWYAEVKDYPWPEYSGQDLKGKAVGHFTQQVWKGSEQVGYGLGSKAGCDKYYVVGRYWPSGNFKGQYRANVLPKNE